MIRADDFSNLAKRIALNQDQPDPLFDPTTTDQRRQSFRANRLEFDMGLAVRSPRCDSQV